MSTTDLYSKYLIFAEEANYFLQSYDKDISHFQTGKLDGMAYKIIHKNVKFIYRKLIKVLCNEQVWGKFSHACLAYHYSDDTAASLNLNTEIDFLRANKIDIVYQLNCMINTTIFETDLIFLDTCVKKLEILKNNITIDRQHQAPLQQYPIAS